jgi:hypothetical protein
MFSEKDWLHCPLGLLTGGKQAEICHNFGIFRVPCNIPTTFGNIEESFLAENSLSLQHDNLKTINYMRSVFTKMMLALILLMAAATMSAQERRPIDSKHPLWLIHIDVWNSADPQKIIDLIPDDIKPYVCMNLSLSCQFDEKTEMYRMPRYAVRTYKSWASVCQANNMWFTC